MIKKYILIVATTALIAGILAVPVKAQEVQISDNVTNVVVLVDFSGSITKDPRYPEAERRALQNLVNVDWPAGSKIAILAFGAADNRNGGKPSTFAMCPEGDSPLRSASNIRSWIEQCVEVIGTNPVGPNTDHNKAIKTAVELLLSEVNKTSSKFISIFN